MEGSYGNILPTSRSPSIPSQSSDPYRINVSRQKTKKWANFKPQNYDGDEWGANYDERQDEPEPQPPPKPMGPRLPAAPSPTERQFQPPGVPPLQTKTQQHPQPDVPQSAMTASSVYSNNPGYARSVLSHSSSNNSPGAHSAGTLPSQFPSRQMSTGLYDAAGSADAAWQSRSNPRLGENPKPWMEARLASSQSAGAVASSNKPLPFIRPADVYRRMEEEAAAGRPPYEGIRKPSGGLTPVSERKSEYGIERLLDSYGSDELGAGPAPAQDQTKSTVLGESAEVGSPEKVRRYSTSPKLPDVARMSGFGEDLFSSNFFPDSKVQSPVSGSAQSPVLCAVAESGDAPEMAGQSPVTPRPLNVASTSTLDTEKNSGDAGAMQSLGQEAVRPPSSSDKPDQPVGLPLAKNQTAAAQSVLGAAEQQQPTPDTQREATSSTKEESLIRPSLPGGWVTETPTSPGETPGADSRRGTPLSTAGPDAVSSVTASSAQPEVSLLHADKPLQPEPERAGDASSAKRKGQMPSHPVSPNVLPSLRTSSPALSTKLDIPSREATPKIHERDASPRTESTSALPPEAATPHPDITPTAPLNPRRESPVPDTSVKAVVSPPSFGTGVDLDGPSTSPVKDSDTLSEEIIKSLSPALSAGMLGGPGEGPTAAYHAAAEPARESSYLGDFYGDYWATTEERVEPAPLDTGKGGKPENAIETAAPFPAEVPKEAPITSSASVPTTAETRDAEVGRVGGLHTRFSWEAGLIASDPTQAPSSTTGPAVEQKALALEPENPIASVSTIVVPDTKLSPADSETKTDAALASGQGAARGVSQPSPSHGLDEPPSPSSSASDKLSGARKLSLVEEKILFEEVSSPHSRAPRLEQHPAVAGPQQTQHAVPPRAPSPKKEVFNVLSFRNIMDMDTSSERIKHYNETRSQYSSMDTGLDEWLKAMMSRHPEHADAGFPHTGSSNGRPGSQGATPTATQGGRPPANIPMPPHHLYGSGGFAHSSNQVGTKSKELLMAAGKAGKGLLSKGRNKLRGTGDKVFSSS
ncbi:hypothetical protein MFIFM68171_02508 [Madurella fahalii]|uniref:Uncharacterized protein n=1 Tax=Madurella fahalii TaxID=1157608 RepID=A0ABQ0G3F5_9PEZI